MTSRVPAPADAQSDGTQRRIVESAYDEIAETYHYWASRKPSPRTTFIEKLLPLIPSDAKVLELGCGSGVPATHILGSDGRKVIGVDISASMIALAKKLLAEKEIPRPDIDFTKADLMELSFPDGNFDAIAGFYSVIHLPRFEQMELLQRACGWLKQGGHLLLNMSAMDSADSYQNGWCGANSNTEMYWSGYNADTNKRIVEEKGFEIVESEVIVETEDGADIPFLWVIARKK